MRLSVPGDDGAVAAQGAWRFEGEFDGGVAPAGRGTLVLSGADSPVQPRRTLTGMWIDGCLGNGARQACIGPGLDQARELALPPPGRRATLRR